MKTAKLLFLSGLLALIIISSIAYGEITISLKEVIQALFNQSTDYNNSLIHGIRIPRVIAGGFIGSALSVSGLLTSTSLRNSLADSGILGIQSGATVGALIALLLLPSLSAFLPLFAFLGGMAAFSILMIISSIGKGYHPTRIVLIGVAVNSVGTSIIGVITLLNVYKIRDAITWLSGSLSSISVSQMRIISAYSAFFLLAAFFMIPILKILLLEDSAAINLGFNPSRLRLLISFAAVILASIGVAFAGVISFIGIIAPQITRRFIGHNMNLLLPGSAITGAILVVTTDLLQRILFAPMEIPVGILIGMLGAPLFIFLAAGEKNL